MAGDFRGVMLKQFEAGLCMLGDCVQKCPEAHWGRKVGKWPFWLVAYHTLCYVDLYLEKRKADWKPGPMHPKGFSELLEEVPSRKFSKDEVLGYVRTCRAKARAVFGRAGVMKGRSGFRWYKVSRAELHLISLRHLAHHTGQLSAYLRRLGLKPRWVGSGWAGKK